MNVVGREEAEWRTRTLRRLTLTGYTVIAELEGEIDRRLRDAGAGR